MDDVLNDRYELGDMLGSGGMGEVYRARDRRLDRTVAVKLLRHGPLADDNARARMRSEALLAASIHHPGVAQVFDYAEDSASHQGVSFIVMQFVEGHSLAELLRENGPMDPDQVMSIVVQVASGLQAAHEAGIVHRDLKPANIMLTPAGRTVLVDFGIATSESSEPLTDTGTVLGTAQYSSPEQTTGRPATPQSDLYSLGVVAHHCLTGRSPFRRDTPIATAMAHLHDDPPPLGDAVPRRVKDLIGALTAKEPSERPASAAAVAATAQEIGADETIDLPDTLRTPAVDDGSTRTVAAVAQPPRSESGRQRPRRVLGVVAAALVLLLALGGWAMWPEDDIVVPDVVGLDATRAAQAIKDAGLTPKARRVDVADGEAGDVVEQDPRAGATAPDDGVVELSEVSGQVVVTAEDLVGKPYDEVAAALEKLGLGVERDDTTRSTDIGDVVALDRSGRVDTGSTITVTVAVAPAATAPTTQAPSASSPSAPSGNGPAAATPGKSKGNGKSGDKGKKGP